MEKFSVDHMLKKAKMHILRGELSKANEIYAAVLESATKHDVTSQSFGSNERYNTSDLSEPKKELIDQLTEMYVRGHILKLLEQATFLTQKYPNSCVIWNLIGASHLKTNELDQAISAFLKVIEINPQYSQAYNNLGTAYSSKGEIERAILAYRKAIEINPHYAEALNNIGQAFMKNDEVMEAIKSYEEALSIHPKFYESYYNLGIAFNAIKDWEQAINAFNEAVKLQPTVAETYNDLGIALRAIDKIEDAMQSYNRAISLKPDFFQAYNNLGIALKEVGDIEEAKNTFKKAITINEQYAEAHNNLGTVLKALDEPEEAMKCYKYALLLKPDYAEALNNLGTLIQEQGELRGALEAYNNAIRIMPRYAEAIYNAGAVLADLGRINEAMEAYNSSLEIKPENAAANVNLGRLKWLTLNFKSAFELMEWRWSLDAHELYFGHALESVNPTWNGEEGKDVFVWKEQGIGDEIMFSSLLSEMKEKSNRLIVECDKRLIPLYERSFPSNINFTYDRSLISAHDYETQIALGSLPKHFRHELKDFSKVSAGWLKADPARVKTIREKLSIDKPDKIIGISWFTKSGGSRSTKRNIPLDILAEYLKRVPGKYVSLQYGDTFEEIAKLRSDSCFEVVTLDEIDLFNDIDGLAALISACDTVISIDNLTVHLAGALGVETKVLLPEIAEERWGASGSDSYWYDHLTLYRKDKSDSWAKQLECLINEILDHKVHF